MRLRPPPEPRIRRVIRWTLGGFLLIHLPIWAASSYAAWFQVYRLEVTAPPAVHPGAVVRGAVVTSGRAWVDLRMELVQRGRVHLLAEHRVEGNGFAGYDQRPHPDSIRVILSREALAGLDPGAAVLRLTATGRPQWTRLPPPTVREVPVRLQPR